MLLHELLQAQLLRLSFASDVAGIELRKEARAEMRQKLKPELTAAPHCQLMPSKAEASGMKALARLKK